MRRQLIWLNVSVGVWRLSAIEHALTFVFSRVVLQPSSKTDFVVLGADAGPSKLTAIKKHRIETLSEDGF